MLLHIRLLLLILLFVSFTASHCSAQQQDVIQQKHEIIVSEKGFLSGYPATTSNGNINVVVEIPAGSNQKWEVDKNDENLKLQYVDGQPRIINYLGYPANYGMIPQTVLPKENGGDGDPLDVIVLGAPLERGSIVTCKLIGVLKLSDHGEQDDKLIAVATDSKFYLISDLTELNQNYEGLTHILQTWFTNYKGKGKISSSGFGNKQQATAILKAAEQAYKNK